MYIEQPHVAEEGYKFGGTKQISSFSAEETSEDG